jgi:hypothetical protein
MEDLPITLSRCPEFTYGEIDYERRIPVVPKSHDSVLTEKQFVDYKDSRVRSPSCLFNAGKTPEKAEGYSPYTIYFTAYRTAKFDLWI